MREYSHSETIEVITARCMGHCRRAENWHEWASLAVCPRVPCRNPQSFMNKEGMDKHFFCWQSSQAASSRTREKNLNHQLCPSNRGSHANWPRNVYSRLHEKLRTVVANPGFVRCEGFAGTVAGVDSKNCESIMKILWDLHR
jgi:hypothetical protein